MAFQKTDDETITVANYLLTRLEQLGVRFIFGLPGDFNLGFLDYVEDHPTIEWAGNCNELNAAYAADGYARVKGHSLGVVLTTFGVGELSAINGIAGAFSEMIPVLHIVGAPSTYQQKTKPFIHHSLGGGRYDAYIKCARQVTLSQKIILNKDDAPCIIDELLVDCITNARPVYLSLPTDIVQAQVSSLQLHTPLIRHIPENDPEAEAYVIDLIFKLFESANGYAVVLADACAIRHDVRNELNQFLKMTGFPVYATTMGKTSVDEDYERYGGTYLGFSSVPQIKESVESASLILSIGALKSDFNTNRFSFNIPTRRSIELHSGITKVQYSEFTGIGMKKLLPKLADRLLYFRELALKIYVPRFIIEEPKEDSNKISHAWFWPRVGRFFRTNDVIVTEAGTSNIAIADVPLPGGSILINQILWGSIGWSVGSTLGAALATKEGTGKHRRTILFVGDGSLQLSVQELSTMIRLNVKPIIFVINNGGYTIERYVHGKDRKYNDISNWNWKDLFRVFGDPDEQCSRTFVARDKTELNVILENEEFSQAGKIQLVEVLMDRMDGPRVLKGSALISR